MSVEVQAATGEQSSAFGCNNQKCKELRIEVGDLKKIMKEKTAQLDVAKHTVEKLQTELKEAADDIAAARAEAKVYKDDFLEERKDRERAQGQLIDLQQEKKGVMQEEMKHLHTEMEDMKEERNTQKMQWALVSGKLKQDLDSAKLFISNLKEQIEKISEERNDLKYEVQRMKDAKHKKLKEYDKLKVQVKNSAALSVHLEGELKKARKDVKELLKFKKKALSKTEKKLEKAGGVKGSSRGSSNSQSESEKRLVRIEQLYEEERDRNEALQIEMELMKDEVEHQISISSQFKKLVQKELIDDTPLSPEEEKSLKSLITPSIDKDLFELSLSLASEDPQLPLKEHLDKEFKRTTSYTSQKSGEFGVGAHSQDLSIRPQSGPAHAIPKKEVMEYEDGSGSLNLGRDDEGSLNSGRDTSQGKSYSDPQDTNQSQQQQTIGSEVQALQALREHLDRIKREKQDMEEERNVWEQKVTAEKENNCELETQVARLTAANEYLKQKINPSHPQSVMLEESQDTVFNQCSFQVEIRYLESKITMKEEKIKNLISSRSTIERRLQRVEEERDGLAQLNMDLLIVKANLNAVAEGLKKEKESLLYDIKDFKNEIEARKKEVSLTTEEYENESRERERIAAVMKDREKEWSTLEQQLKKEISDLNERVQNAINVSEEQKYDIELRNQEQGFKRQVAQITLERDSLKDKLEQNVLKLDRILLVERNREQPKFEFHSITRAQVTKNEEISRGAYGTVCKGMYRRSHIAIKEPHEAILQQGRTIDDLRREVGYMAKVHHPNIVAFIGAIFDDQPMPMILLELMDMNLRSKYKEADISRNLTLKIFQDVAYALHYLHEYWEPIIHRDLSAPNVLLKSLSHGQYVAKVGDLGSANLAKFASTAGRGAIIYSAPEIFPSADPDAPRKKHTVKVDTYSYGILLCEVIIRKLPNPYKRREMLSEAEQKWRDMHKLIMNCIKAEPTERPAMSQILTTLREIETQ